MKNPVFLREKLLGDEKPFCQMVKAGDFLFLTGQTARDQSGRIVGVGDIQEQARQIFRNMRRILALVDCDLTSIIRLTSYIVPSMATMEFTNKYWEVRREVFGEHRPASTGVQVAALMLPEMLIEVDAIAYAPGAVIRPEAQILNP
jgi:2-iminobutanoate/2-iminopropanoate deaminase